MAMMALRWYSFVECIDRCRVVPELTARTFVSLRVFEPGGVIGDRCNIMPSSAHPYLCVLTHYNVDDGSALNFLG